MKTSQETLILEHLKSGQTLSPMDALRLFNCWALSSRVSDLNKQGAGIESRMVKSNGKVYAEYYMQYKVEPSGQLSLI